MSLQKKKESCSSSKLPIILDFGEFFFFFFPWPVDDWRHVCANLAH